MQPSASPSTQPSNEPSATASEMIAMAVIAPVFIRSSSHSIQPPNVSSANPSMQPSATAADMLLISLEPPEAAYAMIAPLYRVSISRKRQLRRCYRMSRPHGLPKVLEASECDEQNVYYQQIEYTPEKY
jgi:hypothetical protein